MNFEDKHPSLKGKVLYYQCGDFDKEKNPEAFEIDGRIVTDIDDVDETQLDKELVKKALSTLKERVRLIRKENPGLPAISAGIREFELELEL